MSLQNSWIEAIHARLHARYGSGWTAKWAGLDPAAIRADWAQVLDGFGGDSIAYALENLPVDWPPTAGEFRELCIRSPRKPDPVIEYDAPPADPARVAALLAKAEQMKAARHPKEWARDLEKKEKSGFKLTPALRHMSRTALRNNPNEGNAGGSFSVIDDARLPPGMKKDAA